MWDAPGHCHNLCLSTLGASVLEISRGLGAGGLVSRFRCVLRASPGSPLAVLQLSARTRTAIRKLQGVSDGPVRAAAALRL